MREISSDSFISNVLIEYIKNNIYRIKIDDLFELEKHLSEQISTEDYFMSLTFNDILSFEENYSFFVTLINNEYLQVEKDAPGNLIVRLVRYFRMGMPKSFVEHVIAVCAVES